jgi:WD40 repeat protein
VQTIAHAPKRIMMCAAFATFDADLPDGDSTNASASVTLLATAGADGSIHLMVQRRDAQFATALQLEGHQDWVRALAFARTDDGALLLASASQDFNVRLWKLATPAALAAAAARAAASDESGECEDELGASFGLFAGRGAAAAATTGAGGAQRPLSDAAAHSIAEGGSAFYVFHHSCCLFFMFPSLHIAAPAPGKDLISTTSLGSRGHLVSIQRSSATAAAPPQRLEFSAILEAVLSGHEDWVFSVAWHPRVRIPLDAAASAAAETDAAGAFTWHQPLCLLTASMDKSMMVWRPDRASSLWLNEVRVGEVGGHTLGFAGGLFGPRGAALLAHGCNGAFHLWRNSATAASASMLPLTAADEAGDRSWRPALVPAGHFAGVQDLCWDATRQYVVSTALDQTTRIVAPWAGSAGADANHHDDGDAVDIDGGNGDGNRVVWHEIARPQTHGFDLHCVCALPAVPPRLVSDSVVFDDDHAIAPAHRFASGAEEKVLRCAHLGKV